jgi:hypothetical protein
MIWALKPAGDVDMRALLVSIAGGVSQSPAVASITRSGARLSALQGIACRGPVPDIERSSD